MKMPSVQTGILPFFACALLASAATVPSSSTLSASAANASAATSCCRILQAKLPGKVVFPGSSAFQQEVATYYSDLEIEINSACRVTPESAQDVSTAITVLEAGRCQFAVRSGGHMPWAGAANIDAPGVTLDLQEMNSVIVSADKKTAQVEPGTRWGPVYDTLATEELIVVGGRSNSVGVGGFLLGGGLSFLSPQHGFASNNIVSYQVVLSNGTIVNASRSVNSDLYFALQAGSTNFGIITSYDLLAYPQPLMWGGFRGYNISQSATLVNDTIQMMKKQVNDTLAAGTAINWGRDAGAANDYVFQNYAYLNGSGPETDIFDALLAVPSIPGSSTIRSNVDMQNLVAEIDDAFPGGPRSLFSTVTIKADVQLPIDIYQKAHDNFAQLVTTNFSWTASFQTLGVAVTSRIPQDFNPQGLTDKDGDLFLLNLFVYWHNPADDDAVKAALDSTISWATQTAKQRNLLSDWLYLNYCLPDQDVYQSYGQTNLNKLKSIRSKYDPQKVFDKFWPGGFKLSAA